jgi:tetratricopeptide (TPR) repeat protein
MQIDPDLAQGHATLGYIEHYEWKWEDAEREFLRAIRLNPSNSLAHIWYANLLASRRRFPEAVREVHVARDLDPFSLVVNTNVAWTLQYAGREEEALEQLRHVLDLDSNYVQAHIRLIGVLERTGRLDAAVREAQIAVRLTGESPSSVASLGEVYAMAGRHAEAQALLDRLLAESKRRYVSPASIAGLYEQLGEVDAAFEWLEKAYTERSNHMAFLLADRHTRLRSDPRFAALVRRVGLEGVQ